MMLTGTRCGRQGRIRTVAGFFAGGLVLVTSGFLLYRSLGPKAVPPPTEPPAAVVQAEERMPGQAVYEQHCSACHGQKGDGAGLAARFLYPRPRNFGEGRFRLVSTSNGMPSDEDLLRVITRGMPGSAMFPFGHLPESDRRDLVAYVRRLGRAVLTEQMTRISKEQGQPMDPGDLAAEVERFFTPGSRLELPQAFPPATAESIAQGRQTYSQACSSCHGDTGKADRVLEQRNQDGMPTRPRDLTRGIFKGGREIEQLYARIMLGLPGSPMPASSQVFKPAEVAHLLNYILSLSTPEQSARVEHHRTQLRATRVADATADAESTLWSSRPFTRLTVTPLWWRDQAISEMQVAAVHDGKSLAVRLTWEDSTRNDQAHRAEDFEDMAAVQFFRGTAEPFLGMGAVGSQLDLWLWRARALPDVLAADSKLDEYPFDTPFYRQARKNAKAQEPPDFRTARVAGNLLAQAEDARHGANLAAGGIGSTTPRPRVAQNVAATGHWQEGRWTVTLRRALEPQADAGLALRAGERYSVAFALWDGEARDRNGQKQTTIWHDLVLE